MNFRLILSTLLVCSILTACDQSSIDPNAKSHIQIRLTDDPLDVDEVNIDLVQVSIKTKSTNGFVDLNTNAGIYDLLKYQAGQDTLIVNDSIPAGEIQEVRLLLGENNTIMVDSVIHPLKVPSAYTSGIKIKFNKIAVQDSLTTVTLDFDAQESVVEKGNGDYSLKPVIKAIE